MSLKLDLGGVFLLGISQKLHVLLIASDIGVHSSYLLHYCRLLTVITYLKPCLPDFSTVKLLILSL